jgi:hypothetical protein
MKVFILLLFILLSFNSSYSQSNGPLSRLPDLPGGIVLIYPPHNAYNVPRTPLFTWLELEGEGITYQIQISYSIAYLNPFLDVSGLTKPEYQVQENEALEPLIMYYWRVRACNSAGCGPWSPRTFIVGDL